LKATNRLSRHWMISLIRLQIYSVVSRGKCSNCKRMFRISSTKSLLASVIKISGHSTDGLKL